MVDQGQFASLSVPEPHIELQQVPASVRTTMKGKLPQQQLLLEAQVLEAQVLKPLMSLPQVPASITTTMKGKLP